MIDFLIISSSVFSFFFASMDQLVECFRGEIHQLEKQMREVVAPLEQWIPIATSKLRELVAEERRLTSWISRRQSETEKVRFAAVKAWEQLQEAKKKR